MFILPIGGLFISFFIVEGCSETLGEVIVTEEEASSSLVSISSLESPTDVFRAVSKTCRLVGPSPTSMVGGSAGHELETKDSPKRKSPK